MTTTITLVIMLAIFTIVLYGIKRWWHPGDPADIPAAHIATMGAVAGLLAVLVGFGFLYVNFRSAPVHPVVQQVMEVRGAVFQDVTAQDLVVQHPNVRVIVDDSGPDAPPVDNLLLRCPIQDITLVQLDGKVKCVQEGSPEAKQLLRRGQDLQDIRDATSPVQHQGFLTTAPAQVATDVAARRPMDRYAEVVYFVLTFLGVLLRLYWDVVQAPRTGRRRSTLLAPQTLVTSLVLAIATYAMIIQSGLAGTSDLLTFKTGIFAIYNGLLSKSFLDLATLRPTQTPVQP